MRRILISFLLLPLLAAGCAHVEDEVTQTYADGGKKKVFQTKQSGDKKIRTAEQQYYPNGTLQYEKHFTGKEESPTGTWNYYYIDGKAFATATFDKSNPMGKDWKFYDHSGGNLFKEDYDTLKVTELSEQQTPATVTLIKGNTTTQYQFYSDGTLRSKGLFRNRLRHGHWAFYHPNGFVQTEADFIDGKENGTYCVYRENGIPYYRGLYSDGQRTGQWEFYDANGNLTTTKQF